jgi:hypothetical protein
MFRWAADRAISTTSNSDSSSEDLELSTSPTQAANCGELRELLAVASGWPAAGRSAAREARALPRLSRSFGRNSNSALFFLGGEDEVGGEFVAAFGNEILDQWRFALGE